MLLFDCDRSHNVVKQETEEEPLMLRHLAPRDAPPEAKMGLLERHGIAPKKKHILILDTEKSRDEKPEENAKFHQGDVIPRKLAARGYKVTRVMMKSSLPQLYWTTAGDSRPDPTFLQKLRGQARRGTYALKFIKGENDAKLLIAEEKPDVILIDQFFYSHEAKGEEWVKLADTSCEGAKVILQSWGPQMCEGVTPWSERLAQQHSVSLKPDYLTVRSTAEALNDIVHYLEAPKPRRR